MVNVNVQLRNEAVRRFLVAFEEDDDAFRATLHPEIEWCPIDENRVPLHGVEAALRNRNAWLETWDEHQLDVDEVVEDGDDVAPPARRDRCVAEAVAWRAGVNALVPRLLGVARGESRSGRYCFAPIR